MRSEDDSETVRSLKCKISLFVFNMSFLTYIDEFYIVLSENQIEEAKRKLEKMNAWIQQQTILSQGIIEVGSELSLFIQVDLRKAWLSTRCVITVKRRWI